MTRATPDACDPLGWDDGPLNVAMAKHDAAARETILASLAAEQRSPASRG